MSSSKRICKNNKDIEQNNFVDNNQNNDYEFNSDFHKKRRCLPDDSKKFLCFSMQKKNMEIIQAINYIARTLKRSAKSLGYAGNKDKRGITTQLVSIYNTLPEEIINLTKKPFWDRRIFIENYFYAENSIKLGQLKGNQFCVCLRFIKGSIDTIKRRIESIKFNGFLNYYGMQRFGCSCIPTHKIGLYIIKKNWPDAILNILNTNAVREIINVKDYKQMSLEDIMNNIDILLKKISRGRANVEFRILKNLKSNKKGFYNAFKSLNRQLQVLYPHAYQSYIWNRTISERIKRYGLQVRIGDIVLRKGKTEDLIVPAEEIIEDTELGQNIEQIESELAEHKEDPQEKVDDVNNEFNEEIIKIEEKTSEMNESKNKELYDKCNFKTFN